MAELLNATIGSGAVTSYVSGSQTGNDRIRLGNAEVTGDYGHYITCIQFTTNANGAANISFDLTHGWWWHSDGSSVQLHYDTNNIATEYTATDGGKYSLTDSFKFAITTSSTALVSGTNTLYSDPMSKFDELLNASGYIVKHQPVIIRSAAGRTENNGHVTTTSEAKYLASYTGSCSALLEPSKTYYIWLYSNYDQYRDDNSWSDVSFLRQILFTGWGHNGYAIVNSEGSYYQTITFDDNGGSGGPGTQTVVTGESFTLSSDQPTKNPTNGYTVTFNANGGSVSPTSAIAIDTYTFTSWNKVKDGTGLSLSPGQTNLMLTANVTLYAQYAQTKGTITLPTPTRAGHTFKGWGTSASASSGVTGNYTPQKSLTLYALWQINTYTLTLNKGTGAASFTGAGTYNYGTQATSVATALPGYHLTQYEGTISTGGSDSIWTSCNGLASHTEKWDMYANRTITVHAAPNTYIVTYDPNGGSGTIMPNSLATYNSDFITIQNTYQKTGYQFNGWNESADGTGVPWSLDSNGVYEHGTTWPWVYTYDITLYAQWKPNTYYIKYDSNGGSGSMENSTHQYGILSNLRKNSFTKEGYEFKGWATTSSATSALYNDEHSISALTDINEKTITLYAVWDQNVFTITTNATGNYLAAINGGGNYSYGDTCIIEAVYPNNCGYKFSHFIKNDTTTITANPYSEVVTAEASFIAYSQPIQYIIQFNSNTGIGAISPLICTYDTDYTLTNNTFVKDGYQFIGWATSPNATTATYIDGATIKNLSTQDNGLITLYAVWKAISQIFIWAANAAGEYGWRRALKYIYHIEPTEDPSTYPYLCNISAKLGSTATTCKIYTDKLELLETSNFGFCQVPDNQTVYVTINRTNGFTTTLTLKTGTATIKVHSAATNYKTYAISNIQSAIALEYYVSNTSYEM